MIHGVRAGFCGIGLATLHYVLTAGVGAVVGGAWGAVVAEGARRAKRRVLHAAFFAVAGPLLGAGISIGRFFSSPMIFALNPFVGYFGGTLYDTVVETGASLWTYRLGTACTLGSALVAASLLARREDGSLAVDRGARGFVCA